MRRLNLGCGPDVHEGWVNADIAPWAPEVYVIGSPSRTPLPWPDDSFDGVVAHHVLQMIEWPELTPWLTEVRRVLAPDGTLRLTVPDLIGAVTAHQQGDWPWFPIADEVERSIDGKLCLYVSQAGATRSVFTGRWLTELCQRAGFAGVAEVAWGVTDSGPEWITELDTRQGESIVVEAWA